jgi:curved DNA-binding protein CbpA
VGSSSDVEALALLLRGAGEFAAAELPPAGIIVDCSPMAVSAIKRLSDDPYNTLSCPHDCPPPAIKKAYRKLVLQYHPDKSPFTSAVFQAVQAAYEVLSNPSSRSSFDRTYKPKKKQKSRSQKPPHSSSSYHRAPPQTEPPKASTRAPPKAEPEPRERRQQQWQEWQRHQERQRDEQQRKQQQQRNSQDQSGGYYDHNGEWQDGRSKPKPKPAPNATPKPEESRRAQAEARRHARKPARPFGLQVDDVGDDFVVLRWQATDQPGSIRPLHLHTALRGLRTHFLFSAFILHLPLRLCVRASVPNEGWLVANGRQWAMVHRSSNHSQHLLSQE